MDEILIWANVVNIWACIGISLALEVIEGWRITEDKLHVKFKESWYNCKEGGLNQGSNCSNDESYWDGGCALDEGNDLFYEERNFTCEWVYEGDDNVEEEEHKKFTIGKAYTIGNPGAMMIHV